MPTIRWWVRTPCEAPMKECTKCKISKELSAFNKRSQSSDGLQTWCKECNRLRSQQYYAANRDHHIKVIKAQSKVYAERNRQFVFEWLTTHPCVDCRESDPIVLEFDHVRGIKRGNLSNMVHDVCSLPVLRREIDKCDVVCANCHRRRTATRQGNYKIRLGALA